MNNKKLSSRLLSKSLIITAYFLLCLIILLCIISIFTWPKLPNLNVMIDYKPPIPLRIYSADNILIGEFGEERRKLLRFDEIPDQMKLAILAAEDNHFYKHKGINWQGIIRASIINLRNMSKTQGASTITMQVARNFYLSSEKTYSRKLYELLLTIKIEKELTKNQILELYMNQIYLGHHSYGFETASLTYLGKPLSKVTIAEAALLAGIPKAPSIYNPISNITRAQARKKYILDRMLSLGYISESEYQQAINQKIHIKQTGNKLTDYKNYSDHIAETVRQLMFKVYKEQLYSKGLNVYTTIRSFDQITAYNAVRNAVIKYTIQSRYNGPEAQFSIKPPDENDTEIKQKSFKEKLYKIFDQYQDHKELLAYLVIGINDEEITLINRNHEITKINDKKSIELTKKLDNNKRIKIGSLIYVLHQENNIKKIINLPSVQAAFISISPKNGAIISLIGGSDFYKDNFNRATQAWRQPGSSIKPFIYAASLEKGLTPNTKISDMPFELTAEQTGSKAWSPKNYGHRYEEILTMRQGLYKSKNMVSIRILDYIGPSYAQEYLTKFGFDKNRHPAVLSMALGTGLVTPLQLTTAFSTFANGGHLIPPYLIEKVTDNSGQIIMQHLPIEPDKSNQSIDPRTAYIMNDMLKGVATYGTASRTNKLLKRNDIAGKTGTTNDAIDAWFSGYNQQLVATAWMGFDLPRSLGLNETGGRLAMPMWIDYMSKILKNMPEDKNTVMPEGILNAKNNFYFKEFPPGQAISEILSKNPISLKNNKLIN
ncbi:MAG: PBP1A family penicillin-binding protein [Candidatus Kinetoplastibacterium crithidii]|nr:MAG: PBP1A family penicillin-binding protein [Candidatus Kinetoplastibacterium crithidii]